ncbi:hypothetical protein IGI49_001947 [Enterococcus sp. AZ071]
MRCEYLYVRFIGKCEEALSRYTKIFGDSLQHRSLYENGEIMYAYTELDELNGISCWDRKNLVESGDRIALRVDLVKRQKAEEIFDRLILLERNNK